MTTESDRKAIAAVGSPVVDLVARVPEAFLETVGGEKGGMELVEEGELARILETLPAPPLRATGGSAGNTAFALARLGAPSRFLGVTGDDAEGDFFQESFARIGGDTGRIRTRGAMPTARCLSLVTPDGERTMRTHLGAAASLAAADIAPGDFSGCAHVHVEGYLLFDPDLMVHVLEAARAAGCTTSVDLASFEVVSAARAMLPALLEKFVDMVFANGEEAAAYAGTSSPGVCLEKLAEGCDIAAVKYGADGALLRDARASYRVPARPVDRVVDTTGAGDLWAAGFLFGLEQGRGLARCGEWGAILGAAAVRHEGAQLPDAEWKRLNGRIEAAL